MGTKTINLEATIEFDITEDYASVGIFTNFDGGHRVKVFSMGTTKKYDQLRYDLIELRDAMPEMTSGDAVCALEGLAAKYLSE